MKKDSFLLFIILFLVSEEINSNENDCCSSSLKPFHATGPFLYTGLFQSSTQHLIVILNPLSANFTKWSNTLKQFVGKLPTNCLSVLDHFVRLTLKALIPRRKVSKITNY